MSEITVRNIAWRVNPNYRGGFVFAEDQVLFVAGQYAEQVVEEHNGYQELKRELEERDSWLASLEEELTERDERLAELVEAIETFQEPRWRDGEGCVLCGMYVMPVEQERERHTDDCPWLLAKQLLEPPAQSGGKETTMDNLIAQRDEEKMRLYALVDDFASEMKARLAQKVDAGYVGWDTDNWSPALRLGLEVSELHDTDDPSRKARKCVDIADFAMFYHHRLMRPAQSGSGQDEREA